MLSSFPFTKSISTIIISQSWVLDRHYFYVVSWHKICIHNYKTIVISQSRVLTIILCVCISCVLSSFPYTNFISIIIISKYWVLPKYYFCVFSCMSSSFPYTIYIVISLHKIHFYNHNTGITILGACQTLSQVKVNLKKEACSIYLCWLFEHYLMSSSFPYTLFKHNFSLLNLPKLHHLFIWRRFMSSSFQYTFFDINFTILNKL